MITEHNYAILYYPRVKTLFLKEKWGVGDTTTTDIDQSAYFLHVGDAARYAVRLGHPEATIGEYHLNWLLEYTYPNNAGFWQPQRYYRNRDAALKDWERQEEAAQLSCFITHQRVRHIETGEILVEWKREG